MPHSLAKDCGGREGLTVEWTSVVFACDIVQTQNFAVSNLGSVQTFNYIIKTQQQAIVQKQAPVGAVLRLKVTPRRF